MNRCFILNKLQLALYTHLKKLLLMILQNFSCCFFSLHKKLLEDVTVREVRGRICEVCLVSCQELM